MQLVMRRRRTNGWYSFRITAQLTLDPDEDKLLRQYNLRGVVITPGNVRRDIKIAFFVSVPIAILAAYLFGDFRYGPNYPAALVALIAATVLIYSQIREQVQVNDLIHGRDFKARSLLDLLQKEQKIRTICAAFTEVLNQARTWDEAEVIDLSRQPLNEILEGTHAFA